MPWAPLEVMLGVIFCAPLELVPGKYLGAAVGVPPLVLAQPGSLLAVASPLEVAAGAVQVGVGYASAVEVAKAWAAEARPAARWEAGPNDGRRP